MKMPMVGFEPTRTGCPADFESAASTDFATSALNYTMIQNRNVFFKLNFLYNHSMINFDALTLKVLATELKNNIEDGRIDKIRQPNRRELVLTIRAHGKSHNLYISINPKYPFLCLIDNISDFNLDFPQKPPMFCMLLRKYMEGAKLTKVYNPDYERIIELHFEGYNEIGDRVGFVLAIELMGKHSNIILYNASNKIIAGCAHNIGPEKSREREMAGGLKYIYPPPQEKIDLTKVSEEKFLSMAKNSDLNIDEWLNRGFYYISLAFAKKLREISEIELQRTSTIKESHLKTLYKKALEFLELKNIKPNITKDYKEFSLFDFDGKDRIYFENINPMVKSYFGHYINQDKIKSFQTKLLSTINKEIKKLDKSIEKQSENINNESKREVYRKKADIIMANLYKIPKEADKAELEDFETGEKIIIEMDAMLSSIQNADKYYKMYSKSKRSAEISKEMVEKMKTEQAYFKGIKTSVEQAEDIETLKQIQEELESEGTLKSNQEKKSKEKPELKEFTSSEGYQILVGRNNKQNEYLLKIARGNDFWLHTHDIPGSHVLIKMDEEMEFPPDKTLEEAAAIAAYYSNARESVKVPVIYTKRRNLKKPPGAKPGYVTYSGEYTLYINPSLPI